MTNASDCRVNFQTLSESVWAMAALSVLAECGVITALQVPKTLVELKDISHLPEKILLQSLQLVIELNFVTDDQPYYLLSKSASEWIAVIGIERFLAQTRTVTNLTQEFIKAARAKNLQSGWHYSDPLILNAQGTQSEYIVTDCIPQDKTLQNKLKQSGAVFLDIGAGVAKISIRLCKEYSSLQVVALEPADAPYQIAHNNITQSPYQNRITLRRERIEDIRDENKFDVIWYPHFFLDDDDFIKGLEKIRRALKPDGMLLTTVIASHQPCMTTRVRQLQNALFGGIRSLSDVENALQVTGFSHVNIQPAMYGYQTITAKLARHS